MNWYYIDGPLRVGPHNDTEWEGLLNSGKITPETLVWHEGLSKWTPYKEVPVEKEEEEDELPPPVPRAETKEEYIARVLNEDYPINTWELLGKGWALLRNNFGMILGSTLLCYALIVVGSNIPYLSLIFGLALNGVIVGGCYYVYLRLMRGEHATITDLFAGFQPKVFGQLAMKTLINALLSILAIFPVGIAAAMMNIHLPSEAIMSNPEQLSAWVSNTDMMPFAVLSLVALACSIPVVYLAFCWYFALPLIIDKRLRYWEAMQLSRRKVLQHPWKISVFFLIAGIIGFSGVFLLGIGLLFTLPLYLCATIYLYQAMFGDAPIRIDDGEDEAQDE